MYNYNSQDIVAHRSTLNKLDFLKHFLPVFTVLFNKKINESWYFLHCLHVQEFHKNDLLQNYVCCVHVVFHNAYKIKTRYILCWTGQSVRSKQTRNSWTQYTNVSARLNSASDETTAPLFRAYQHPLQSGSQTGMQTKDGMVSRA